jgi:hypothetical protein
MGGLPVFSTRRRKPQENISFGAVSGLSAPKRSAARSNPVRTELPEVDRQGGDAYDVVRGN